MLRIIFRDLATPEVTVITSSVAVANYLLGEKSGRHHHIKIRDETARRLLILPIDLDLGSWPALVLTLKPEA